MKTKLLFIPILALLFSCEVEGDLTRDVLPIKIDQPSAITKLMGTFAPSTGINVKGKAIIFTEMSQYKLKLIDFSISSGPDLKVYLSKTNTPNDFINLGNLNPSSTYSIPQNIDIENYKFVLIHCQQYNHLFAIAELTKN